MKKIYIILIGFFALVLNINNINAIEETSYNPYGLTNIGTEVPFKVNSNRNSYYNTEDGYIYAYGSNLQGNFGTGDKISLTTPTKLGNGLEELRYPRDWSLGIEFSTVIDQNGDLWVAGNNGITGSTLQFTKVTDLDATRLLKVEAAYGRAFMINEDGILFYGNNNTYTEVVNNSGLSIIDFCTVGSVNSTTNDDAYCIMSDGSLYFSDNGKTLVDTGIRNIKTIDGDAKSEEIIVTTNSGELFQGSSSRLTQVELPDIGDDKIIRVAQGTEYEGILTSGGQVYLRGTNNRGKFGNGLPNGTYNTWQEGLSDVAYFDIGYTHSLYVKNDKKVYGAGINDYGQLGTGSTGVDQSTAVESTVVNNSGVILPLAPTEHSELPEITPTLISNNTEVNSIEYSNTFTLKTEEINLNDEIYNDYDIKVIISGSSNSSFIVQSNSDLEDVNNYPKVPGIYKIKYQLLYSKSGKVVSETKEASISIATKNIELVATNELSQYLTYINQDYSLTDVKNNIINGIKNGTYLEEVDLYTLNNNQFEKVEFNDLEDIIVNITQNGDSYNVSITINLFGYTFNVIEEDFKFIENKTLGDNCLSFNINNDFTTNVMFSSNYTLVLNNPNNYNVLFRVESESMNVTFYLSDLDTYTFREAGTYTVYTSVCEFINNEQVVYERTTSTLTINKVALDIKSDINNLSLFTNQNILEEVNNFISNNVKLYKDDVLFTNYTIVVEQGFELSDYNFSYSLDNNLSVGTYNITISLDDDNYDVEDYQLTLEILEEVIEDDLDEDLDVDSTNISYTPFLIVGIIILFILVIFIIKNKR